MPSLNKRILDLFETIHPLDRIARAGYVLRGVPEPESVSAHSHFVSLLALLFLDAHPGEYDREKVLTMAVTHDLCEAEIMDIPMPAGDRHFAEVKNAAEVAVTAKLLDGFDTRFAAYQAEFNAAETPEARLLRGLDKAQMMLKIWMYEREGVGRLEEFWLNPKNFRDYGIPAVSELFDAICARAGRNRPKD